MNSSLCATNYILEDHPPDDQKIMIEGKSEDDETHHLSLNAMWGSHGVGTIRFTGQVGSITVNTLVYGGSSDNFIQPIVAQVLKLPVEPVHDLRVLVGNGEIVSVEGIIQQLPLQISVTYIILGSTWLAILGPHVADYAALTLKFFKNCVLPISLYGSTTF